jgi:hypothetical protein
MNPEKFAFAVGVAVFAGESLGSSCTAFCLRNT